MIKALWLLFAPGNAWGKIVASKRGVLAILLLFLLPLLVICAGCEGYALLHWGDRTTQFGRRVILSKDLVMRLELTRILVGLAMVFAGAKMIQWVGESFHFYPRFQACFTVAAYGLSPVFMAHILNCVPAINTWVSWALGVAGCVFILYQGIGMVLEPDQTKGFGLYLLIVLIYTLLSAMAQVISLMVLQGKLPI